MAKIAPWAPTRDARRWHELDHALAQRLTLGTPGRTSPRTIAAGDDWTVADVVCTCGPGDRPYEERHDRFAIALVLAGTFQYRSPLGRALMTPGSLMLGNSGQCFECGHTHGEGDRCVSFWYAPEHFEQIAADAGIRRARFTDGRVPPLRELSPLMSGAVLGVDGAETPWEELSVRVAARALKLAARGSSAPSGSPLNAEARVTHAIRTVDRFPARPWTLGSLSREAGLSRYHFLRTFERLVGVTPHQYLLRARLRDVAVRLVHESASVLDVALDSGFGDVSNFNRAFRREFGVSPREYRERRGRR